MQLPCDGKVISSLFLSHIKDLNRLFSVIINSCGFVFVRMFVCFKLECLDLHICIIQKLCNISTVVGSKFSTVKLPKIVCPVAFMTCVL